jgi:hypothetical protein
VVRTTGPEETARIAEIAQSLGIAEPFVDDSLRRIAGSCAFLDPSTRSCRIHAAFGADAKPLVCREYPLKPIRTEDGVRVAMDPGCSSTWQTFEDGPVHAPLVHLEPPDHPLDPPTQRVEAALLTALASSETTLSTVLWLLAGRTPSVGLPPGLGARVLAALGRIDLAGLLAASDASFGLIEGLGHLPRALAGRSEPPELALSIRGEALALETLRRSVFLRLLPVPFPMATAGAVLVGVLAAGWADPRIEVFGPALSQWTRLIRIPRVGGRLFPTPAAVRELLVGR